MLKAVSTLLAFCFLLVGCDPNGHYASQYAVDTAIDSQVEKICAEYDGLDSEVVKAHLERVANYGLSKTWSANGGRISHSDLMAFAMEDAVNNGIMEEISSTEIEELSSKLDEFVNFSSPDHAVDYYENVSNIITAEQASFLRESIAELSASNTKSEYHTKLNRLQDNASMLDNNDLKFNEALAAAISQTTESLCFFVDGENNEAVDFFSSITNDTDHSSTDSDQLSSRTEETNCWEEERWVIALTMVLMAVVGIILGILNILSFGALTPIVVALWVLAIVIICATTGCEEPVCPDGQVLTCFNAEFTLNDGWCESRAFNIGPGGSLFRNATSPAGCMPGEIFVGMTLGCAVGQINTGIFSDLTAAEDYFTDGDGLTRHRAVCN